MQWVFLLLENLQCMWSSLSLFRQWMQFSKLNFGELKVRVCYRSWKDVRTSLAYQGGHWCNWNPHTGSVCKDLHMFNPLGLVWRLAEFCCGSKSVPRHNCITWLSVIILEKLEYYAAILCFSICRYKAKQICCQSYMHKKGRWLILNFWCR